MELLQSEERFRKVYAELHGTYNILVAYSGGLDSRVLLELCHRAFQARLEYQLQAVHIHHGLHDKADEWANHCQFMCNELDIPLRVLHVSVDITNGQSFEERARIARRTAWREVLPKNGTLLLGHHQDDQVETILYRLCRGTGPKGLSGISKRTLIGKGVLIRPFLDLPRTSIASFAMKEKLSWVEDDSNAYQSSDRNFLRHKVLPFLKKRWSGIESNIARTGELCAKVTGYLEKKVDDLWPALIGVAPNTLSITRLLALVPILRYEIIRSWILYFDQTLPSKDQMERIENEIMLARIDKVPILCLGKYQIRRYRDDLYLLTNYLKYKDKFNFSVDWKYEQILNLPYGARLIARKTVGKGLYLLKSFDNLTIQSGQLGEKAKKIFQKFSIPPWERVFYPAVFRNSQLLCLVGLWVKKEYLVPSDKVGIVFEIV